MLPSYKWPDYQALRERLASPNMSARCGAFHRQSHGLSAKKACSEETLPGRKTARKEGRKKEGKKDCPGERKTVRKKEICPEERLAWKIENRGGPAEIRTLDPQLARLVLYQLSYRPTIASLTGQHSKDTAPQSPSLAPQLFGVFGGIWWAWVDSNYRPHAYQACTLTS